MSSQIDLNTILIGIVLAISGWTLKTVLGLLTRQTQVESALWGKDGQNGHASDIRRLRDALAEIGRQIGRLLTRVERLEDAHGVKRRHHREEEDDGDDTEDH